VRAKLSLLGPLALVAAGAAAAAWRPSSIGADYVWDAGPALQALAHGHVGDYVSAQPLMGALSILIRWPLAALATAAGAGELAVYRIGAVPLVMAAGVLGLALAWTMRERGHPPALRAVVVALCLLNPMTFDALKFGHPEEILGGALCVGALLAAGRGRATAAGVLLGLAIATKQWALVAVAPALVAAPRGHARLLLSAGAVAAALWLPLALGDASEFAAKTHGQSIAPRATPTNVWWPLASESGRRVFDGVQTTVVTRTVPRWASTISHPLIVALGVPLALLYWRRRRPGHPEDALALLALLLLARCALDPNDVGYYHVPLLLSLTAWEALRPRGLPLVAALTAGGLALLYRRYPAPDGDLVNALYLLGAAPLAAYLALGAYAPARLAALGARLAPALSRPRPSPSGTS
jgi:hypothetical protein